MVGSILPRRWLQVASVTGVLALAAGCGTSASRSANLSPVASPPTTVATPTPHALTPVTVVEASDSLVEAPVVVAESRGLFQAQGLRPKILLLNGNTALSTMVGGSAQFDADVAGQVITADSKGAPALAVATLTKGNDNAIVVSNAYARAHHIVPTAPIQQRLDALKGAKFGISAPGASSADTLTYMLHWAGVPSTAYHQVALGAGSALMVALQKGSVDAFLWSAPQPQEVAHQGFGSIVAEAASIPSLAHMAYSCIVTTRSYASQHPTVVHHFVAAIRAAEQFMYRHPRQTQTILARHFHYPAAVLSASLKVIHYSRSGAISPSSWHDTAAVLAAMGLLPQKAVKQVAHDYSQKFVK